MLGYSLLLVWYIGTVVLDVRVQSINIGVVLDVRVQFINIGVVLDVRVQ